MKIGITFAQELYAAGLKKPMTWDSTTGVVDRTGLTPAENTIVDTVLAAHDPAKPPPRIVPESERLLDALISEGVLPGAQAKRDAILARVRGA